MSVTQINYSVKTKKDVIAVVDAVKKWLSNETISENLESYITANIEEYHNDGTFDSVEPEQSKADSMYDFLCKVKNILSKKEFQRTVEVIDYPRLPMWMELWEIVEKTAEGVDQTVLVDV